jgi:hypothetical protein
MFRLPCLVLLLAVAVPVGAQPPDDSRPQPLKIPALPALEDPTPTFRIKIEPDWPIETPLQVIRRELGEEASGPRARHSGVDGMTTPLVSVDVMPMIMSAIASMKAAHHAHLEADAEQRVEAELADFCTVNNCTTLIPAGEGVVVAPPAR